MRNSTVTWQRQRVLTGTGNQGKSGMWNTAGVYAAVWREPGGSPRVIVVLTGAHEDRGGEPKRNKGIRNKCALTPWPTASPTSTIGS